MTFPPFSIEYLNLPDDQLAIHLWAWWIAFNAERRAIDLRAVPKEFAENLRIKTLDIDTDIPELAPLEKVLRLIAKGEVGRAGKMFRSYFQTGAIHLAALDEMKTSRRRQRKSARKARPDPLRKLILEIVKSKPSIREPELLKELRKDQYRKVIDDVDFEERKIYVRGRPKPVPFSGLKDRLSRAKGKPSSR